MNPGTMSWMREGEPDPISKRKAGQIQGYGWVDVQQFDVFCGLILPWRVEINF